MQDKIYICPTCSSSAVQTPALAGMDFNCESCGWNGPDALYVPFKNPLGSGADSWNKFATEILTVFTQSGALPVGRVLVKWGFVPVDASGKPSKATLVRYLKAMAGAIVNSVVDERKTLEAERVQKNVRNPKG